MLFDNLELVKEYPGQFLKQTKPLRIYRSHDASKKGKTTSYRYHFGYPKELVEPFCPLLEATLYWGEPHWTEIDGFWLWWTSITVKATDYYPLEAINKENGFRRHAFSQCLDFYRRRVSDA